MLILDNDKAHFDERFIILGDERNATLFEAHIGSQTGWQTLILADGSEHLVMKSLLYGLVLFNHFSFLGQSGIHDGSFTVRIFLFLQISKTLHFLIFSKFYFQVNEKIAGLCEFAKNGEI